MRARTAWRRHLACEDSSILTDEKSRTAEIACGESREQGQSEHRGDGINAIDDEGAYLPFSLHRGRLGLPRRAGAEAALDVVLDDRLELGRDVGAA